MWELAGGAVAKAILSRAGSELAKSLIKGRRDREAFDRAVTAALTSTELRHRDVLARFDVNPGFLEHEGAEELAKLLRAGPAPDPRNLALACVASLGGRRDARDRERLARELEAPFVTLIDRLVAELGEYDPFLERLHRIDPLRSRDPGADERAYLAWVIDEFGHLGTAGIGSSEPLQLPLREVFVTARAVRETTPGTRWRTRADEERALLTERLRSREIKPEEYEARIDRLGLEIRAEFAANAEPAAVTTTIRNARQVVLLGDPGAGKTTLLRYLAVRHAQAALDRADYDHELGVPLIPIYVRLGSFARAATRESGLRAFIPAYLTETLQSPVEGLGNYLDAQLRAGRCLVLLDGLDEITTASERHQMVGHIASFATALQPRGNRIVCTSRIAGYAAAPLTREFQAFRLLEMDDAEIQTFLRQYLPAIERREAPEKTPALVARTAEATVAELVAAFRRTPGLARLTANPLLLTAVVLVHRTHGRLPERRVDAYKAVTGALGRTWRSLQGVPESELPDARRLTQWLTRLADWMHAHRPEGSATVRDLLEVFGPLWAKLQREAWDPDELDRADASESDAARAIVEFVELVERHTGLLVERAPRRWGFPHLTYEEYYAGRALAFDGRASERPRRFRQRLHDPRYTEPILLGLGLIGSEQPEEIEALSEAALLARGPDAEALDLAESAHEDILGRDFLFALRALADEIPMGLDVVDELLTDALDQWFDGAGPGRHERYRVALHTRLGALDGVPAGRRLAQLLDRRVAAAAPEPERLLALATVLLPHHAEHLEAVVSHLASLPSAHNVGTRIRAAEVLTMTGGLAGETAVERLRELLSYVNSDISIRAAEALAASAGASSHVAAEALVELLAHPNIQTADYAARVLALVDRPLLDEVAEPLSAMLHADDLPTSIRTARVMTAAGGDLGAMAGERLSALLEHHHIDVRVQAASVLASSTTGIATEADQCLAALLTDENPATARYAGEVLVRVSGALADEIREALASQLANKDPHVALRAGAVLLVRGGPRTEDAAARLATLTGDENPYVAIGAAEKLIAAGFGLRQGSLDQVAALVSARDPHVADYAARTLARAAGQLSNATGDRLRELLVGEDQFSAMRAMEVMTGTGAGGPDRVALSEQRTQSLIALASDAQTADRWRIFAIELVSRSARPDPAIDTLLVLLGDRSGAVRRTAASGLARVASHSPRKDFIVKTLRTSLLRPTRSDGEARSAASSPASGARRAQNTDASFDALRAMVDSGWALRDAPPDSQ